MPLEEPRWNDGSRSQVKACKGGNGVYEMESMGTVNHSRKMAKEDGTVAEGGEIKEYIFFKWKTLAYI